MKLNCDDCTDFLTSQPEIRAADDMTLITCKNRGGLTTPNPSVNKLCQIAEAVMRSILSSEGLIPRVHQKTVTLSVRHAFEHRIHDSIPCLTHSISLITTIISRYALVRVQYETTLYKRDDNVRQRLNRIVLFSHT